MAILQREAKWEGDSPVGTRTGAGAGTGVGEVAIGGVLGAIGEVGLPEEGAGTTGVSGPGTGELMGSMGSRGSDVGQSMYAQGVESQLETHAHAEGA